MLQTPTASRQPRLQRVDATGGLSAHMLAGRTRLGRLYQEGAAKIRLPRTAGDPLEAILINTAGGLTGGDRVAWSVDVGAGASAMVTTQACEKLYRAGGGLARLDARLTVGSGGRLAWLPQETIAYDGCAFARRLDVDLAGDARLLFVEATMFGRQAMGETVARGTFRDRWRVRRDGVLVHAEEFVLDGEVERRLRRRASLDGGRAMAAVLLVGPDALAQLDPARAAIGALGGASAWLAGGTGKLLARLVAGDSLSLRRRLVPLLALLNDGAGMPKAWSL